MTPRVEMIGRRFGKLTVLALSEEQGGRGQLKFLCRCDCGRTKIIFGESLRSLKTTSCGCEARRRASEVNKTHGGSKERLYHVWQGMKNRCENKNFSEYKNYGGRGIKVCEEWHDYAKFKEFMLSEGYDPRAPRGQYTLERIDVNGNYEPSNCTVISSAMQAFNRTDNKKVTFQGETQTVAEWSKELGIPADVIYARLHRGVTDEEALTTPLRKTRQYIVGDETHTCKEWAEILQMPWSTLRNKLQRESKTMEQIVNERRALLKESQN